MLESDGTVTPIRWRWLGRLLPRDVRERIFEPALADLTHSWLTGDRRGDPVPLGLHAFATWFGCMPIAIPRLLVRNGRLTRTGRVFLVASAVFGLYLLAVSNQWWSYPEP